MFCCVFDAAGPGKLACWWHVLLWGLVAKSLYIGVLWNLFVIANHRALGLTLVLLNSTFS